MNGRPLEGIRVIEVAQYGFVPSAGVVLADWGAEVIKIEDPRELEPTRVVSVWGLDPARHNGFSAMWEMINRGKKSVGLDLGTDAGREALYRLVESADVFTTNFRGPTRQKLKVDAEHIQAINPRIVYGRGTGFGPRGPQADLGGFDVLGYWCRNGAAVSALPAGQTGSIPQPGPAFGDVQSGAFLAGGIAAALYRALKTGKGSVVDASLLSAGLWANQIQIAGADLEGWDMLPPVDRTRPQNPLQNVYMTSDGRSVSLTMLVSDRYWAGFCRVIGRPELETDARFSTAKARSENTEVLTRELDAVFAQRTLEAWKPLLDEMGGQWSWLSTPGEAAVDPQAEANSMIQRLRYDDSDVELALVMSPAQIDGCPPEPQRAPGHGEHTESVLLDLGYDWPKLAELKEIGAIL